jgi:hypothetical protein
MEWNRVVDLVMTIIKNIYGFKVCKWTGVPEKRDQIFMKFYMNDAQPQHN